MRMIEVQIAYPSTGADEIDTLLAASLGRGHLACRRSVSEGGLIAGSLDCGCSAAPRLAGGMLRV